MGNNGRDADLFQLFRHFGASKMNERTNLDINWAIGTPKASSPKIAEKQSSVQERALQKQALFGSPQEQRVMATAVLQGNRAGQAEEVADIWRMNPIEFAERYGQEAQDARMASSGTLTDVYRLKNRQRTSGEMLQDSAIDAGLMAANTVGGAAALGLNAIDQVLGTDNSARLSQDLERLGNYARSNQSQLMQDRREQHEIEAALDSADRDARYEERSAEGESAWLAKQVEAVRDTVMNYADDPIMAGSLVPEGVGSMAPSTVAIRGIGRAAANRELRRRGMNADEASAFLRTDAGKELVNARSLAAAPAVVGLTETGAALNQTQQDVLSMDETELSQSEDYQTLRANGLSHEEAQMDMARIAGGQAAVNAAPGALMAGKLSAPFAANPLRVGPKNALPNGARNIAAETVEEGLQEANSQLANNTAVQRIGIERALDEGVAEAAAQGALSGVVTAGPLQSPGMILQTGQLVGEAALGKAREVGTAAVEARGRSNEAALDRQSAVGQEARVTAGENIQAAVGTILEQSVPVRETVETETPGKVQQEASAPVELETLKRGAMLDDAEKARYSGWLGDVAAVLEENPEATIPRNLVVDAAGRLMGLSDVTPAEELLAAAAVVENMTQMSRMDSTEVAQSMSAYPEGSEMQTAYEAVKTDLRTLEASPVLTKAREILAKQTPEGLHEMLGLDRLNDPELAQEGRDELTSLLLTVAQENPEAVRREDYDLVLNQLGPNREAARAALESAKRILDSFQESDERKAQILEDRAKVEGKESGQVHKPADVVRQEIRVDGNSSNNMKSYEQHRKAVVNAARHGREEEAQAALAELRDFVLSQSNKAAALNTSAELGTGRAQKIPFEAHGPYGMFMRDASEGVFFDRRKPRSVALAREIHSDAVTGMELMNALSEGYGIPVEPVSVAPLHPSIANAYSAETSTTVARPLAEELAETAAESTVAADPVLDGAIEALESRKPTLDRTPEKKKAPVKKEAPAPKEDQPAPDATAEPVAPGPEPLPTEEAAIEAAPTTEAEPEKTPGEGWFERAKTRLMNAVEGTNLFLKSFKPAKRGSLLPGIPDLAAWSQENLDAVGGLSEPQREAMKRTLEESLPDFAVRLQDGLEAMIAAKRWKTSDLPTKARLREALPLAFVSDVDGGNITLDPQVTAAAFVGVFEWMLANSGPQRTLDDERLNKIVGRSRGSFIDNNLRKALETGVLSQAAVEEVATKIQELLDVKPDSSESSRYTQGVMKSLAASALEAWTGKDGFIETETVDTFKTVAGKKVKDRSFKVLRPVTGLAEMDADFVELMKMRTPFSKVLTQGRLKERFIGEAPTTVEDTQLGNRLAKLSRKEKEVLRRLQDVPSRIVTPMVDLVDMLGQDMFRELIGFQALTEDQEASFNPDHLMTIKGKNQTILHDLQETMGYVEEARQAAGNARGAEIFFKWAVSSVGRLQQVGRVTPQGSKIAREMIAATHSVLDLDNPAHSDALRLAVAQSLGLKVEILGREKTIEEVTNLVANGGPLTEAVAILQLLQDPNHPEQAQLKTELRDVLKAWGKPVTPKVLHALLTMARANEAYDTDGASQFETALALEADGKTDGPINAMIHMSIGEFTPDQLSRFAKGGLFFTSQEMSLDAFIRADKDANGDAGGKDLYNTAAEIFHRNLMEEIAVANPARGRDETLRLLSTFLEDFTVGTIENDGSFDPADIEIGRGVPKNPLTVFLYGSGENGIAGKVAKSAIDNLMVMLTEIAQSGKSVSEHPAFTRNPTLLDDLAAVMFDGDREAAKTFLTNPTRSQMNETLFERMQANVLEHFAQPMIEAVDETTGGLAGQMRRMQAAASAHTAIFQDIFEQKLAAAQAEAQAASDAKRRAAGETPNKKTGKFPRELLSEDQTRDVFAEAMKIAPIYGTDAQSFHISAPRKATMENITVAESFGKDGKTITADANYIQPADASVKVSPYLTIGTGDGRMILNIYADGSVEMDNSLPVFDGVEMGLDQVDAASVQINKSTFEAWMDGNPYRAIEQGMAQLLAYFTPATFDALSDEAKLGIRDALQRDVKPDERRPASYGDLASLREEMRTMADQVEARKKAMKIMVSSSDHMASAGRPYLNEGRTTASDSALAFDEISEGLNEIYNEELQNIERRRSRKAERARQEGYAQAPTKGFQEVLGTVAPTVPGHEGVRAAKGNQIASLISQKTGATPAQIGALRDMTQNRPIDTDTVVYFGEPKALEALRDELHPDLPKSPIEMGQTFSRSKVAFVANLSPETLLHEMIHMQTADVIQDYTADPSKAPEHVRFAMDRLRELEAEVMDLSPEIASKDQADALLEDDNVSPLMQLQHVLRNTPRADERTMEMVSYMLSNQGLIEKGQQVKTYRPLMSLVKKGLSLVARLLGIRLNPGTTLYSNIRMNAQLLTMAEKTPEADAAKADAEVDRVLNQRYGTDARLDNIEQVYLHRLNQVLQGITDPLERKIPEAAVLKARGTARKAAEMAAASGFTMDARQARAFEAVHAAMTAGLKNDAPAQRHLYEAFVHVMKTLSPEDFIKAWGLEGTQSQENQAQAEAMRDFLIGAKGLRTTADGRTDMLASFMGLAQVHPELRSILGQMQPPKNVQLKWDSVDDWFRSIGTSLVNLMTRASMKPRRMAPNLRRELDLLSETLTEIQGERRFMAAAAALSGKVDQANDFVSRNMARASETVSDRLNAAAIRSRSKIGKTGLDVASMVASLGSAEASAAQGERLTTMLNHAPGMDTLRELVGDLRGMTESNAPLMRLINPTKATIDALRQDFREGVPAELAAQFSRPLKKEEWKRLHSIARTDVLALGYQETLTLLKDPSKAAQMIQDAQEAVQALGGPLASRYEAKARALGHYLATGQVTSRNLQRNAHAIAHLYGEQGARQAAAQVKANPDLIDQIDRLTSLYAFEGLDPAVRDTLADLSATEEKGMGIVAGFLRSVREMEMGRRDRHGQENLVARNNGWKGYVPTVTQEGTKVIVAEDADSAALLKRGYVRVGDYKGDKLEGRTDKRGYYQTTVGGRNSFRQGVAQTVHETYQGVDARTGKTTSSPTGGLVLGADSSNAARTISNARPGALDGLAPGEYMLPIYGSNGEIVAMERSMAPERTRAVPQDENLGRMLGIWAGRILEETVSDEANTQAVAVMKELYDDGVASLRTDEFVNIIESDDPVIQDAWNTLGWRVKAEIQETFGNGQFMVRRDMVNDFLGYRAASVTDPWSGISRWNPETQKKLQKAAEFVIGNDAFKRLRQGENLVQDLVSYAKTTIIVRSIKVAVDNLASNMLHLSLAGVPITAIMRGTRDKFSEITELTKNRQEILRLQVRLAAVIDEKAKAEPLKAQIRALEEANGRLSIAPLIEAGEFSTISESLTEADVAIREGRWIEHMEKSLDKLPSWGKTAAKNLLITKDTAVFQGLNRMVQYGDFVAKAVLYDHLTKTKKQPQAEVLDRLQEEFVNYNRLPGRGRDFLESMGLMWFWNYKIRIMKVLGRMMRDRPLNSLVMMGGASPLTGIDSVWDGSAMGGILDGRAEFAIGPEMGFRSPTLHPVLGMAL